MSSSFRQWRSKRERDPSVESRTRKRFITQDGYHRNSNEKENKQLNQADVSNLNDKSSDLKIEPKMESSFDYQLNDGNDFVSDLIDDLQNNSTDRSTSLSPIDYTNDQVHHLNLQSNQTLKQKLVSLNNSKFVIEEGR